MAEVCTVYLSQPVAPDGKDWAKGYIESKDASGVTLNSRDDWRGERTFYPIHVVQRIAYNTSW